MSNFRVEILIKNVLLMKKTKLTLKDVALQLGVSTATISNAFNRPDQLSKAKREEILSQCQKIGYTGPNKAAQILRKGTSNIVALVLADSISYMVRDPVASKFIQGVSEKLQKHGKHLLLYAGDSETILDVVDFVDGFICYGAPRNSHLISELSTSSKLKVFQNKSILRTKPHDPTLWVRWQVVPSWSRR